MHPTVFRAASGKAVSLISYSIFTRILTPVISNYKYCRTSGIDRKITWSRSLLERQAFHGLLKWFKPVVIITSYK